MARDEAAAPADDTPWSGLGSYIREQRRLTHLSLRKLAEAAEVSNPYLSQIERGLRKPSADILQGIARALSISAESLYEQAGMLERREVDVVGEVRRDTSLRPDQRRQLIELYRSFRQDPPTADGRVLEPDPTDQEFSDDLER